MPSKITAKVRVKDGGEESRERKHHKSSRSKRKTDSKASSKSSSKSREDLELIDRSPKSAKVTSSRRSSAPIPELKRRVSSSSPNASRTSLPYPSFSKAHSREAVGSKDNLGLPQKNIYTPEHTDLSDGKGQSDNQGLHDNVHRNTAFSGPPSPPLTADHQTTILEQKRRNLEKQGEDMKRTLHEAQRSKLGGKASKVAGSSRNSPLRSSKATQKSQTSSPSKSRAGAGERRRPRPVTVEDGSSIASRSKARSFSPSSSDSDSDTKPTLISSVDSSSTSIAPAQAKAQVPSRPIAEDEDTLESDVESSPKTPTPRGTPFQYSRQQTHANAVPYPQVYAAHSGGSPMPPPPPPPPMVNVQAPRVDYLMQNGGLPHSIPKIFLTAVDPTKAGSFALGELPDTTAGAALAEQFFRPFKHLLNGYVKIMEKSGSVAVATGYRSVARRLLDRLEAVFARDISSEICPCMMCEAQEHQQLEDERSLSWGEILEYVSGRRELPPWPPFVLHSQPLGLGILEAPMQKLDIDVPEEYRDHYVRQSKKTKLSVDRWLAGQTNNLGSPPDEADDDTLFFAMLTHLNPEERNFFSGLLDIKTMRPPSVAMGPRFHTPASTPNRSLLANTGLAIQRLYRLKNVPRAPESAIFLVSNHHLHNTLATLAAISDGEWEILISGRFDGFLRSGAEDASSAITGLFRRITPSFGQTSRGPTPMFNRAPTPGSAGAPVALDEETEIAVLAEVERDIYLGMETLEDAFEALHVQAEAVRHFLRERGAGLYVASQARKGLAADVVEARLGTPAKEDWDVTTDDGIDDAISELAPDDSASNISRSRIRRPKRRHERRTPAPVEEEDEDEEDDDEEGEGTEVARRRSRR